MCFLKTVQRIILLFAFALSTAEDLSSIWNYDNPYSWGVKSPICDGYRQSPIHLKYSNSFYSPLPPLQFENYDIPLKGPLKLVNNGHSINMKIPRTRNGERPLITGGMMLDYYEAVGVHFHWGSPNDMGSEHMINNQRYNMEMHILHKNVNYETIDEANLYTDGLSVLAIMFKMVYNPDRFYPGLNKIFNKLPELVEYDSEAIISEQLTLGQLIGDVNTNEFFTYKGSLTTPPCSEAVTWQVFPEPLPLESSQVNKFFDIVDSRGDTMMSNYRPLQPLDGRRVIFRTTFFSYSPFL